MTLPFPYPILGRTYDSNGAILSNTVVSVNGDSNLTLTSDSDGKYIGNLMDYVSSGNTVTVNGTGLSEKSRDSFKMVVSNLASNVNVNLTEANSSGKISINTARNYGNKLYIFTPTPLYSNNMWYKTIDG